MCAAPGPCSKVLRCAEVACGAQAGVLERALPQARPFLLPATNLDVGLAFRSRLSRHGTGPLHCKGGGGCQARLVSGRSSSTQRRCAVEEAGTAAGGVGSRSTASLLAHLLSLEEVCDVLQRHPTWAAPAAHRPFALATTKRAAGACWAAAEPRGRTQIRAHVLFVVPVHHAPACSGLVRRSRDELLSQQAPGKLFICCNEQSPTSF